MQGGAFGPILGLAWLLFLPFNCLPGPAWADGNLLNRLGTSASGAKFRFKGNQAQVSNQNPQLLRNPNHLTYSRNMSRNYLMKTCLIRLDMHHARSDFSGHACGVLVLGGHGRVPVTTWPAKRVSSFEQVPPPPPPPPPRHEGVKYLGHVVAPGHSLTCTAAATGQTSPSYDVDCYTGGPPATAGAAGELKECCIEFRGARGSS